MSTNTLKIILEIDAESIVEFNQNLGSGGQWGSFDFPFDAIQFLTISSSDDENGSTDNIPILQPNQEVPIQIEFVGPGNGYEVEMDHFKLLIVGYVNYHVSTPRSTWLDVLNLGRTDGAIAADGNFYLGQNSDNGFMIVTSEQLNDNSPNLNYSLRFVIKKEGKIRYCQIDPLLKTSSSH